MDLTMPIGVVGATPIVGATINSSYKIQSTFYKILYYVSFIGGKE